MRQPLLVANDVIAMRGFAQARENLRNPKIKNSELPDDGAHFWAKAVELKQRTGRWMWEPKSNGD